MKRKITKYLLIIILFYFCANTESNNIALKSEIKQRKYNLDKFIKGYDSSLIEIKNNNEFHELHKFYTGDTNVKIIMYNVNKKLIVLKETNNGLLKYVEEFYENKQSKGTVNIDKEGKITGYCEYYHENGRIRAIGNHKGFNEIGIWINFDSNGNLIKIENYPIE